VRSGGNVNVSGVNHLQLYDKALVDKVDLVQIVMYIFKEIGFNDAILIVVLLIFILMSGFMYLFIWISTPSFRSYDVKLLFACKEVFL
jgi:hypothetical protein